MNSTRNPGSRALACLASSGLFKLPGMNGIELARRLLEQQPDVTLVFISGAGDIDEQAREVGARFLLKPFALSDLRAVLV